MSTSLEKYNSVFATRLRELMTAREVTMTALANALGISRQAVSQYQDGSTQPNMQKLIEIAKYFNVSTDWLLGLTDIKSANTNIKAITEYTSLSEVSINLLHSRFGKFPSQFINLISDIDEGYWLVDAVLQYLETAKAAFRALYIEQFDCIDESWKYFDSKAHITSARLAKLFAEDMFEKFLLKISPLNFDVYYSKIENEVFGGRYSHDDVMSELLKLCRRGKEARGNG